MSMTDIEKKILEEGLTIAGSALTILVGASSNPAIEIIGKILESVIKSGQDYLEKA